MCQLFHNTQQALSGVSLHLCFGFDFHSNQTRTCQNVLCSLYTVWFNASSTTHNMQVAALKLGLPQLSPIYIRWLLEIISSTKLYMLTYYYTPASAKDGYIT